MSRSLVRSIVLPSLHSFPDSSFCSSLLSPVTLQYSPHGCRLLCTVLARILCLPVFLQSDWPVFLLYVGPSPPLRQDPLFPNLHHLPLSPPELKPSAGRTFNTPHAGPRARLHLPGVPPSPSPLSAIRSARCIIQAGFGVRGAASWRRRPGSVR